MRARHYARSDDGWSSSLEYAHGQGRRFFVIFVGVWSKKAAEAALNRLREKILRVRHISPLCLCACEVLPLDEL